MSCEHHWHFRKTEDPDVIEECYCSECDHTIQIMRISPAKARELYERHGRNSIREGIQDHEEFRA